MEQEYKYMVFTSCFTYNHAPYVVDAMNGFTMQETTFPVVTLIVDDASTDGEPEIIRQYLKEHFQKPYREEETKDYFLICAAHNTNSNCSFVVFLLKYNHYSIKKSKLPYLSEWLDNAKYHAFCEGDDYWIHSKKLQMQVDFLESHEDYEMVYTAFQLFYQNTKKKETIYTSSNIKHNENFMWEILEQKVLVGTSTVLMSTKLYKTIKALKEDFKGFLMGDTQLWFHSARISRVYYLSDITSVYRKHMLGATATFDLLRRISFIKSCLNLDLHLAYKYGAPLKTIKIIKDKFGVYCFNMYLRQQDYASAKLLNRNYFHSSWLFSLSIVVSKLFSLKKLRILGPLHHIEVRLGMINVN